MFADEDKVFIPVVRQARALWANTYCAAMRHANGQS